jgi:ligand-binding sensor domain-containing protein/signal transduction histidine kinase
LVTEYNGRVMYYTLGMNGRIARIFYRLLGLLLAFALASCGSGVTPLATPKADSAPISRPPAPNRISPDALPEVCNCVLRFDQISIEQGLSQSSVRVIFQDSRGFLWFGTEDGLNRYDGYTFKIYKPQPGNPNSLSDGWVSAMVEDAEGHLWVGTRLGGLNRYDPGTGQFTRYQHDGVDPASLSDDHIRALFVDKDNQLWVGTFVGLDRFEPETGKFKHYPYGASLPGNPSVALKISVIFQDSQDRFWIGTLDGGLNGFNPKTGSYTTYRQIEATPPVAGNNPVSTDPQEIQVNADTNTRTISLNRVTALAEDLHGAIWVGTQNGLYLFNPETGEFKHYMHEEANPLSIADNAIYALLVDSSGNLWIGTSRGLDRLNQKRNQFIHYRNDPSFPKSLSNNFVLSIYEDRGGVLWFGTYGGVNKYDRWRDKFALYRNDPYDPASLSGNFVFSIQVDYQGFAWVGTYGDGLNRFNPKTGKAIHYKNDPQNPNSPASDLVMSLIEDENGFLWIGTMNGLDRFDPIRNIFTHYRNDASNPDSLSANNIYAIHEDRRGRLWVGTFAGLDLLDKTTGIFSHYRPGSEDPTTLSGNQVNSIFEDANGNLWVGTFESGLNRLDLKTNVFTRYRHNAKDETSLSSDSILTIQQDSKGRLWIGTAGGGLNLYHPETDSFTYYLEKDGLPNAVVHGILEDESGNLWLSTNHGISRFNPDKETFRNFDAGDGLQSNEFSSGAYARGRDGEFYFGGINGLTVFHPSKITDNPYLPQIILTSLTQDGMPVSVDSSVETIREITLRWPQNSLEFEFAALGYNQPDKNQYAYMLEGFDTNWHYIGTKRDGRYTNLPGGEYKLLLKATNSDGIWNDTPVRIKVTIIPPFWQALWFRVLLGAFAVVVVAGGFRLRTRAIQERNRALERIVKERTYALEKRGQEIQALYEADERILRNVSLNQVYQTLVDVAVDMLNADRSVVFAWDEKRNRVIPLVSHGFAPETLRVMEFEKGEGIVGEVFATGNPVIIKDLEPDHLRPDVRAAITAEGIKSFAHLPIVVDHKVAAVFNVSFTKPDAIGEDTMRLFSALTHRASLSIANMELFEQTKDLAVMEERNRLARDLHDSAKQKAFAALAQLGTARGILNGNENSATLHLSEAENLVSDVIQELTFLVQEIYPIALQDKGLATALREYIFEWENRNDITVQFATDNEHRLSIDVEQALYRVAQESLANVARHSHAKRVELSLAYNGDAVQLSVSDDGCGFDVDEKSRGMGLRSIRERISSIHGTVQVQSAPGRGTRIFVQVPIKG